MPPPGVLSVPQVGAGGRGGLSAAADDDDDATWRNARRSRVAERSPLGAQRSPPQTPVPCSQPGPTRVLSPLPGRIKMSTPHPPQIFISF